MIATDIDTGLNLELLHAGIRKVAIADPPGVLDHIRITVGMTNFVRDVVTAIAELFADDRPATAALLDALAAADAEVKTIETQPSIDYLGEEISWEAAFDRAMSDREDLARSLLTRVHDHTRVSVGAHEVQLSVTAARALAGTLLLQVAELDDLGHR